MGLMEKVIGIFVIPTLLAMQILISSGILRKKMVHYASTISHASFLINRRKVYIFPLIAAINVLAISIYYFEIQKMLEPREISARSRYLESLYRIYRNMLLNITCIVLIFELFYNSFKYKGFLAYTDKL